MAKAKRKKQPKSEPTIPLHSIGATVLVKVEDVRHAPASAAPRGSTLRVKIASRDWHSSEKTWWYVFEGGGSAPEKTLWRETVIESKTVPPSVSTTVSEKPIVEPPPPPPKTTADEIVEICDGIKALLLRKNAAYGDSALKPMRVFSRATPVEQIMVRLDDKLSRLARGHALPDESLDDTLDNILGYLVLLKIAKRRDTLPFGSRPR